MIAATMMSAVRTQMLTWMVPVATSSPAVNSMESPGRKKPISSPVSAKMMPQTSRTTHGAKAGFARKTCGLSQSGRKEASCGWTGPAPPRADTARSLIASTFTC